MREIKFRGKFIGTGEWVYGDLIHKRHTKDVVMIQDEKGVGYDVLPETVGQCTGLKDASGREVYEGDILRVSEYKNTSFGIGFHKDDEFYKVFSLEDVIGEKEKEYETPVEWEEGGFVLSSDEKNDTFFCVLFGDMRRSHPIFIFEVIGNIYDKKIK